MSTAKSRLHAMTDHKSWVIVGGLLGMLAAAALSVLADLAAGKAMGSTIIANLERPNPVSVVTSSLFLVGWFGMIFTAYRHKRHKSESSDEQ